MPFNDENLTSDQTKRLRLNRFNSNIPMTTGQRLTSRNTTSRSSFSNEEILAIEFDRNEQDLSNVTITTDYIPPTTVTRNLNGKCTKDQPSCGTGTCAIRNADCSRNTTGYCVDYDANYKQTTLVELVQTHLVDT